MKIKMVVLSLWLYYIKYVFTLYGYTELSMRLVVNSIQTKERNRLLLRNMYYPCYGLNICVPTPQMHVEMLPPHMMVLGGGASGR